MHCVNPVLRNGDTESASGHLDPKTRLIEELQVPVRDSIPKNKTKVNYCPGNYCLASVHMHTSTCMYMCEYAHTRKKGRKRGEIRREGRKERRKYGWMDKTKIMRNRPGHVYC